MRGLLLVTALPLLVPLIYTRDVQHKLRVGQRAEAEVLAGRSSPPGDTRSLGALDNGLAIGRRRVDYRTGPVEEEFKTDRPWTQQLGMGARMAVLVDPARPQVWFDIGVLSATPKNPPQPAH